MDDLCSYVLMTVSQKKNVSVNLCTGRSVSVQSIADQVIQLTPHPVKLCYESGYASAQYLQFD